MPIDVQQVYEQEDEITVKNSLIASNGGHFQFSLCPRYPRRSVLMRILWSSSGIIIMGRTRIQIIPNASTFQRGM